MRLSLGFLSGRVVLESGFRGVELLTVGRGFLGGGALVSPLFFFFFSPERGGFSLTLI